MSILNLENCIIRLDQTQAVSGLDLYIIEIMKALDLFFRRLPALLQLLDAGFVFQQFLLSLTLAQVLGSDNQEQAANQENPGITEQPVHIEAVLPALPGKTGLQLFFFSFA